MKIVQLLPELNEGGVERGVMELSRELVKLGHESIVISAGGRLVKQIEKDGGKHITLDICSKNILTAPLRVRKLNIILKEQKADILHARSRIPAWMTYLANRFEKVPFVTTVHGYNSINIYSKVMTYGDKVICGSQFMVNHIIKHYQTNTERIVLIPRGIDMNTFNTPLDEDFIVKFKKKHRLENTFVITQVARITHWKDQKTTIRAFAEVKKKILNAKLLLVGGVDKNRMHYYEELKQLIKVTGYAEDIIFTGNQQKVKEIFSLSDVSISASNKPETFGRANVESIFMGVPLIATNIGATADYVKEAENGYLFLPNDFETLSNLIFRIKNSLFDEKKMKEYIKNNFSLEQMVLKNMHVYNTLSRK